MNELVRRCLEGDVRAVARFITHLENGDRAAFAALYRLKDHAGNAQVVGITGPPGAGKSTLADKLIAEFRKMRKKVGVLAVDPSSPFSGGAILGDRLRMQGHATDPGVFIRSLASRGSLGGISSATHAAIRVLDAAGYDIVLVETVGVGQSEVDIVRVADTVVLVSVPGLGDDIQVIKAGIMEIGDIFVVNKADRDGADKVVREIRVMLETQAQLRAGNAPAGGPDTLVAREPDMLHHAGLVPRTAGTEAALPPVLKTIAETGEGVPQVAQAILTHFEEWKNSGALAQKRLDSISWQLRQFVQHEISIILEQPGPAGTTQELAKKVLARKTDIYSAGLALLHEVFKEGAAHESTQA